MRARRLFCPWQEAFLPLRSSGKELALFWGELSYRDLVRLRQQLAASVLADQAWPRAIAKDTTIMHANAKLRFISCSS